MTNLKNSFIFCAFCHVVIFFLKNVCQVIIFTPSSLFIVLFWRFFVKEDWHGFFKNNIVQKFWAEPPIFICCFQGGRLFHLVLRNSSLDFEGLSKFFFGLWTKKQNKTGSSLIIHTMPKCLTGNNFIFQNDNDAYGLKTYLNRKKTYAMSCLS